MKLNVERQPASLVVLDITAEDAEFAEAMERAFRKSAREIQVPGFRKGKAPRGMIERMYGREMFLRDAADEVMDRLYREALEQENITPVGDPEVEITDLEPVAFKVTVPVYPTIDPGDYTSVRVDSEDAAVTDEDVEEVLERLRTSQAPWVEPAEARKPREGDRVNVDYEVNEGDGAFQDPITDAQFILGETNLLQQLRERIEEMEVGQTETFDLAFDDDDETADPTIRGKQLTYTVTLTGLSEREPLELNDAFAQTVADAGSLDDLRQQVRDDIHQGKTTELRTSVVNTVINRIGDNAEVDPPAVMVEEEVDRQLNQLKQNLAQSNTPWDAYLRSQDRAEDDVREDLRPEAHRRLRNSLLLQEIAKREEIEVTDEELDAQVDQVLDLGFSDAADEQRERMRQMYRTGYFRSMMRNELFEKKLTDRLIEIATEGRGAVLNAWVPAEPLDDPEPVEDEVAAPTEVEVEEIPVDAVGDVAEVTNEEPVEESVDADQSATADDAPLPLDGDAGDGWVRNDGAADAPEGFPIKGNADSMIYHPPASRSYDSTVAEVFFANEDVAEAHGFRAPKGVKQAGEAAGDALEALASDES